MAGSTEDDLLFEKVCADLLEEFGIDLKAKIESMDPLDKARIARHLRDVVAPRWRKQAKNYAEMDDAALLRAYAEQEDKLREIAAKLRKMPDLKTQ